MGYLLKIVLVLVMVVPLQAADELADSRKTFEARMAKLSKAFRARVAKLDEDYRRALGKLEADLRAKGDLDSILVVREELKRFDASPKNGAGTGSSVAGLATLQQKYAATLSKLEHEHQAQQGTAFRAHLGQLTKMRDDLTKQRKIEDAKALRDEILLLEKSSLAKLAKKSVSPPPSSGSSLPLGPKIPGDYVLLYSFDKKEGDGRVLDSSEKKLHATTEVNAWTEKGKRGGAIDFTGDEIITLEEESKVDSKNFTIATWIHLKGGASYGRIWDKYEHFKGLGYNFQVNQLKPVLEIFGKDGVQKRLMVDEELTLNKWHHLAVTVEPGKGVIYLNGKAAARSELPKSITRSKAPINIGQADAFPLNGYLDELLYYARTLSAEEISQIYKNSSE